MLFQTSVFDTSFLGEVVGAYPQTSLVAEPSDGYSQTDSLFKTRRNACMITLTNTLEAKPCHDEDEDDDDLICVKACLAH